jgi:AraC-like DNA-binding protein
MEKVLAISDIHPRDRLAYWYDVACKVLVKHECRIARPSAFDATMLHAALGDLGVVNIESLGLRGGGRTARAIRNAEDDVFFLCLQLDGSATLSQDGREAVITPGDFTLLDAQRPFTWRYTAHWKQVIIKIPHRALKTRLATSSDLTAYAVRHNSGVGGLASGYISMLPKHIGALQPTAKPLVAEHVLDLAALALAADTGKDTPALSSARAVALLHLRSVIESRLTDPSLSPGTAASAAGISVRYANDLLSEQATSLERYIVSRRLERCRRALEDPRQAHRTISEIAYAWGFSDLSHFDRRFKAVFGTSPGDHRRQHGRQP